MKRKRKLTIFDLKSLPSTPVVNKPRETLKTFTENYNREETARQEAPLRKLESDYSQGLRENQANVKEFFSLPTDQLNNARPASVPVDFGIGSFPESAERPTAEEYRNLQLEFWETLNARGCSFNEAAWIRFNIYVGTLARERKFAITLDFLEASFQRLLELSCFNDGELTGTVPKTKQPAPEPEVNELEPTLRADVYRESIPSSDPRWRKIVSLGWTTSFNQWFFRWLESLRENWAFDFPIDRLGMKAANFLDRWNLSPFVHSSWDAVRIAFVRSGDFPEHMLTPSEQLSQLIENSNTNDYSVRRELGRRSQELINSSVDSLPRHK